MALSGLMNHVWPGSVKARLAAIFMIATTTLMCAFGGGSYYLTQQRLHQQKEALKGLLRQHLSQPVAKALWVFDVDGLNAALDAELGASVLGLAVYDEQGKLVSQRGDPLHFVQGGVVGNEEVFSFDVPPQNGRALGRIQVNWSDAELRKTLSATLWLAVAEVVGANLFLLAILWVGVDKLVFQRILSLQRALDHAASRSVADDMTALPVTQKDEFGAMSRSINAITERLGAELDAGREAEEEARAALSNLQSAQDELVRSEKMASLGRLVAGVSHELNTPIGNIVMVASTQQEIAEEFERTMVAGTMTRSGLTAYLLQSREGAELMLKSANKAAELIHNFKQVAVDQTSDRLREFDLASHIGEVLSVLGHLIAKMPLTLSLDLEPGIAMYSYPGPMDQVLTNLVVNAVKHGFDQDQPGTIAISAQRHGELALIQVSDNGKGIDPLDIGKIFDPFFTTKMGQGGTGLGLHISHNMVYGPLRGTLSVESTPGQGTTFTLAIPCRLAQVS